MALSFIPEKKLGFGFMRLPKIGDEIDHAQVNEMVDRFMQAGFTYFDTAYVYHEGRSECELKTALVDRYPRDSFTIATKMPPWAVKSAEDLERIEREQLERLGIEYFDYYLLHSLDSINIATSNDFDIWNYVRGMKERGTAKHIGFSFHSTPEKLDELLTLHPDMEFVQLQINYSDWENPRVRARECYEVARKHNKPIIIMEPVRGGSLSNFREDIADILKQREPDASLASWALRYVADLDGILSILSGMSTLEQVEDNIATMDPHKPLTAEDHAALNRVLEELAKIPTIPCTGCNYCTEGCPANINIPSLIRDLNSLATYNHMAYVKNTYAMHTNGRGKASDCLACGACEGVCPQHIDIIEQLKKASELFD